MKNISFFFDTLEKLSMDDKLIAFKRRKISDIGSRFQYRKPNVNVGSSSSENGRKNSHHHAVPEDDAVDVILKALLDEYAREIDEK